MKPRRAKNKKRHGFDAFRRYSSFCEIREIRGVFIFLRHDIEMLDVQRRVGLDGHFPSQQVTNFLDDV
jgi:hypothetical protein